MSKPSIKTTLLDTSLNKNSDPLTLKLGALETVDSFSNVSINVYTDGSATRATTDAGAGVLLKYPDGTESKHSIPFGKYCSNYEAELLAINKAVNVLHSDIN